MAIGQVKEGTQEEMGTKNKGKLEVFLSVAWSSTFS